MDMELLRKTYYFIIASHFTDFYLVYRGASYHSNLDTLDASFAVIRFKANTDLNLLNL